jgi:catechol 2,3-dioxygenase-like lactoylglutathione lyase family enzyme
VGHVTGFFHGGITVNEIDRSLVFDRDGLGLEIEFDRMLDGPYLREVLGMPFDAIRAVYLRIPGGGFVELLAYRGIERFPAASRPCYPGTGHLCLDVDIDSTAGPNAGARSAYVADPDGYYVELFQKRPGP